MKKWMVLLCSTFLLCLGVATANVSTTIDDAAITSAIKIKMAGNPIISALDIRVITDKGVVALLGDVKTSAEVDTAVEIASSVDGVSDVNTSHLHVQGNPHPLVDSLITAKVKGTFLKEKVFGHEAIALSSIHVTTNEGVVYLKGKATKEQANNAERLAKLVKGVKEVKSDFTIKS